MKRCLPTMAFVVVGLVLAAACPAFADDALSRCGMDLVSVTHLPPSAYAFVLRGNDDLGGFARFGFKNATRSQVTGATQVDLHQQSDGTFVSNPIVVAAPKDGAETVVVDALGATDQRTTCRVAIKSLADVAAPAADAAPAPSKPIPLLTRYDVTGCTSKPVREQNVPAHKLSSFAPQWTPGSGQVAVRVDIDNDGNVATESIVKTTDKDLNIQAFQIAFLATFAPTILACHPVGGAYEFVVHFGPPPIP